MVGDLVADHYVYGQTDRVSREAPVLIVRYEASEVKLGGGANAAANARSLGAQVTAVGALGAGRDGRGAARAVRRPRASELAAVSASALQTETKTRILAGGLNTTRQQMLRVDRGQARPLPAPCAASSPTGCGGRAQERTRWWSRTTAPGWSATRSRAVLRKLAADGAAGLRGLALRAARLRGRRRCASPTSPSWRRSPACPCARTRSCCEAGQARAAQLGLPGAAGDPGPHGMALFERRRRGRSSRCTARRRRWT